MSRPRLHVVGLGPAGAELLTAETRTLLSQLRPARLRTRRHPAATEWADIESYDEWYERADSFEELYDAIAADVRRVTLSAPAGEALYAVPGSPTVAESTVLRLATFPDIEVVYHSAVSVIDVACATLGRDPMAEGLRILDALSVRSPVRGPGPLLILQTYRPEVLASLSDFLPPDTPVRVLHHLGLPDEATPLLTAARLSSFADADHLTSVWIDDLRTAGVAVDDLVDVTRTLREQCPWDQEQTHQSLTRHLIEEAYELVDALESMDEDERAGSEQVAHVEEELGDVLFQVLFHAELGVEEDRFSLTTIADQVREKLIGRHPHVYGDVVVADADEVANNWEANKKREKGRASVVDGIAQHLPALSLYEKLWRKARSVDLPATKPPTVEAPDASGLVDELVALCQRASEHGVDLEAQLRGRARALTEEIRRYESTRSE